MSVSRADLSAALVMGVENGVHPSGTLGPTRIHGLVDSVLGEQLDLVRQGCAHAGGADPVYSIGFVVGRTLTSPELRVGDIKKPANRQLVLEIARHALLPDYTLELVTALGGSETPPTLRAIAYVTPALELAKACQESGLAQPAVRLVAAHAVSSSLNGLDPEIAEMRAHQLLNLVDRLQETVYPNIKVAKEHLSVSALSKKGHESDTEHLLTILQDGSVENETPIHRALRKLAQRAVKHASIDDGDQHARVVAGYGAAHGLTYRNYRYPDTDGTIKIGGQGEAAFDVVQQYMADRAKINGETVSNHDKQGSPVLVSLRTVAGTIPPYYLEGPAELTVESPSTAIPSTVSAAAEYYAQAGLRSGIDFANVPDPVRQQWSRIVR